jgi:acyl-CoA reductase-like NAD-dependent aldehyde dehydrogenase
VSSRPAVRTNADPDRATAPADFSPAAPLAPVHLGLLTSVFTRDLARGLKFAESARAGWVNINEGTNYWESHLPFGGRAGSQSRIGRVGGRLSIERLTELKTIAMNLA